MREIILVGLLIAMVAVLLIGGWQAAHISDSKN